MSELKPEQWVDEYGDYLYRYAYSRLRNAEAAEEVLQETLLAGLKAQSQYEGRGSERGWLLAILKRKIIDFVRARSRTQSASQLGEEDIEEAFFSADGRWKEDPRFLKESPEKEIERQEFWQKLSSCLEGLSQAQQDAFILRELEGQSTESICEALQVTTTNLGVLLYRGRLKLARCLRGHFFQEAEV